MHNPFPGMNPYLEQPGLWPQVHNRLIVALADVITLQVAPKYWVSIEERVYTTTEPLPLVGIADIAIAQRVDSPSRSEATTQLTAPRRVQVPLPVELTERFLEVRLVQTNLLVCVIEVLSPTNKRVGEGRTAYEAKRQKILASATHLVEIDLLRSGPPLPLGDPSRKPYSILVSRSGDRPNAELYEFDLPDPIPYFPVPLQANDLEPVINLQQVVNELYSRARLDLAIDYSQPVKPELSESEITWITGILPD
ncbi:MAG: DUF4058 family protein [Tildeniella torsiva UHER 1998/13D]|jgi:hypothetical protein|nr:DUF4058 family protein [Tildeniella torsiva UHER 1998/13D]